ncbi:hypothetical protein PISMIDRAFT_14493 [Pisolithus microcarpus 441]|uniref:Uncharacterized protein n=1 Tax=Pisolithus microcarpus 441 TaxID=765257 RepID=A0A0C9YNC6_9AGAM|nr:hypothetical protein PISMIDRAFT_14493 [Pisolithus microcarpus 441]
MKPFIMAFGVRVLIQGHDLYEVFVDLLDVSIELRMHSDTFLFSPPLSGSGIHGTTHITVHGVYLSP